MEFRKYGFSLIELLVVIAVMAAITTVIVPSITGATQGAKFQKALSTAEAINLAQVSYRLANGTAGWPANANTEEGSAACYLLIADYLEYPKASLSELDEDLSPNKIRFQNLSGSGKFQKVTVNGSTNY